LQLSLRRIDRRHSRQQHRGPRQLGCNICTQAISLRMNAVPPWAQIDTHHVAGASLRQAGTEPTPSLHSHASVAGLCCQAVANQSLHDWWRWLRPGCRDDGNDSAGWKARVDPRVIEAVETVLGPYRRRLNKKGPIHAFDCSTRDFCGAQQMAFGYWRCMCIHVPHTCMWLA
jgi:hypothetical protein